MFYVDVLSSLSPADLFILLLETLPAWSRNPFQLTDGDLPQAFSSLFFSSVDSAATVWLEIEKFESAACRLWFVFVRV